MQGKRVYQDMGNGLAVALPLKEVNGTIVPAALQTNGTPVNAQTARNAGFTVLNSQQAAAIAPDRVQAEMSGGGKTVVRAEVGSNYFGEDLPLSTWNITLNNTGATDQTAVIGDAMGLVALYEGIPALTAAVVVNGTFGENSLAQIKAIAQITPIDLHGIHVEASTSTYFAAGNIQTVIASLDNNGVTKKTLNLGMVTSDMTQTPTIRKVSKFRSGLYGNRAITCKVPAGQSVTLIFGVNGAGLGALIERVKN